LKVIRKTVSLSPLTNRRIPATVVEDNGCVYMIKKDERGREYKALIERDVEFYKMLTTHRPPDPLPYAHRHVYLSDKCNLKCPICYEAIDPDNPEPTIEQLRDYLRLVKHKHLVLGGREPTMREDLVDVTKMVVEEKGTVCILTNGLKFANYDYAASLRDAGISTVAMQFNGFDDDAYKAMIGVRATKTKLKALENLKKLEVPVIMSFTLAKGMNEKEIKPTFDYVMDNLDFILDFRIRSVAPTGDFLDVEEYTLSELMDLCCAELGFTREEIFRENELRRRVSDITGDWGGYNRVCSINFYVKKDDDGGYHALGREMHMDMINKLPKKLQSPAVLAETLRTYTLDYFKTRFKIEYLKINPFSLRKEYEKHKEKKKEKAKKNKLLRFVLRSWPTIYQIDMIEMNKCVTGFWKNFETEHFCAANILQQNKVNLGDMPKGYSFIESNTTLEDTEANAEAGVKTIPGVN